MSRLPLLVLLLAACDDPPRDEPVGPVTLTVLHAAPGRAPLTVAAGNEATIVASALPYTDASTAAVVSSNSTLQFFTDDALSATLTLEARPNDDVTAVAFTNGSGGITAGAYALDFDSADAGTARARFVHGSHDLGEITFDFDQDGVADTPPVHFRESTNVRGHAVPADLPLVVSALVDGVPVATFALPALSSGDAELFVLAGSAAASPSSGEGLSVLSPQDGFSPVVPGPQLSLAHAVLGLDAIDVFEGDVEVASNVFFGELSRPLTLNSGRSTLDVFPAESGTVRPPGSPSLSATTSHLTTGDRYLGVFAGTRLVLANERGAPGTLSSMHAAVDVVSLNVGLSSDTSIVTPTQPQDMAFGEASTTSVALPGGITALGLQADGQHELFPPTRSTSLSQWTAVGVTVDDDDFPELWLVDRSGLPWTLERLVRRSIDQDDDTDIDTDIDTEEDSDDGTDSDVDTDTDSDSAPVEG